MSITVYLSNEDISYLEGDIKKNFIQILKCGKIPFEKGVLSDGKIMDDERMQGKMELLKTAVGKQEKGIDLLLDSTACITKTMYIPVMSSDKIMSIVKEELQDYVDKDKEYLYDYSVLEERCEGEQEKGRIFCAAIEKKVLQSYLDIFRNSNFKINSIDVDKSAQIRLVENHPMLKEKTFILCVLDGDTFSASLYVAGKFTYMNEIRLQEERDNLGLISELSRVIASFIQFNRAQRTQHEIRNIYFCGMTQMEVSFCPNITNNVGITTDLIPNIPGISGLSGVYSLASFLHTTGNLFRG